MIANNASGMRAIKNGATGDLVLGLKVVLPQGELVFLCFSCIHNFKNAKKRKQNIL